MRGPRVCTRLCAAAPTLFGSVFVAGVAAAQNLPPEESVHFSRYTAVRDRQIPGYETVGVPIGSFILSPAIEASVQASDNVYALDTNRVSDVFVQLSPSARLSSNWTRRSLDINADASIERYARQTSENVTAANISALAVQDFGNTVRFRILGRYRANRESRESQNAFALTDRPVAFREETAAAGLSKRLGAFLISGEASYQGVDFDNATLRGGGVLDQDYRDGHIISFRGRADYIQTPALAYFVQGTNSTSSYSQLSPAGVRRGAGTTEILVGARFELPILVRGELGIGYITSGYRDEQFRRFSGLAVNSRVTFFPTQLTTITLNALRSVNDAGTPNSSTYVTLQGGIQVDHELLRSLILGAGAQYQHDSFNGVDRRDDRIALNGNAEYRMNKLISLRVTFDRLDLSSRGLTRYKSFTRNRGLVALALRI